MSEGRPAIPVEIRRAVLIEARHHCAVCCTATPLEFAHIRRWSISHDHSAENLIALCANCHSRADKDAKNWGEDVLRTYKKFPCILARSNAAAHGQIERPVRLVVRIPQDAPETRQRIVELASAIAAFLEIPGQVTVESVEQSNSSRIVIRLPELSARSLVQAFEEKDPRLLLFFDEMRPLAISSLELDETKSNKGLNLNDRFYPTFRSANPTYSPDTFKCAEETLNELLHTSTSSEHPGMLLGKVQSGKTRTFISVMALAFDNGFDIAVVLSKNSRALLEQTQKRLLNEFEQFVNEGDLEVYDIMHAPDSFSAYELDAKLIFVAKKQDDNLKRLIALFQKNPAMAKRRVLIIDDEADAASVGYTKKDGLIAARTIATQVSSLRTVIGQVSFLQVTATPYSLYLQPEEVAVSNVVSFKPTRPAFTKLVPVPGDYVGGDVYFGESSRSSTDTLESLIHHTVDHNEFDRLKQPDGRSFKLEEALSTKAIEGYRTALTNFIVGGCIQTINGRAAGIKERKLRYSFLLHSEAGKSAHDWQEVLTNAIVSQLAKAAQKSQPLFRQLVERSYEDLVRSLKLDNRPVPTFADVLASVALALTGDAVKVIKVNSDDDVASLLDSTGQLKLRGALNIFIGGQVLDRGVTLANLIGFYYGRRPQKYQQDTVLQHSRMYGYRRTDLAVTRFSTSKAIRHAMSQMEEFDASLRAAIEAGGDRAVQFIRTAADGTIKPCSPNKILVATTQTLRPHKRILPIGFQSGYKTGAKGIGKTIEALDEKMVYLCGFNADEPMLVPIAKALELLEQIETTLEFPEDDAPLFDWDAARAALIHLSQQHSDPKERGQVWLWAAKGRESARLARASSHATYIETPDSEKTEGQMAKKFALEHPILFLLRQNGSAAPEKGWRGTPFYWPVIRAQAKTPTSIYTSETID